MLLFVISDVWRLRLTVIWQLSCLLMITFFSRDVLGNAFSLFIWNTYLRYVIPMKWLIYLNFVFKGYVVISTVLFSSMVSASLFIMAKDFVSSWKKEWPFSVSCWFKLGFLSTRCFSFCSAAAGSSDDTAGSCSFSEIRLDFLCRRLYHLCCKNGRKINFLCLTIF